GAETAELVETVRGRQPRRLISEMPFPEAGGRVAGGLQQFGEGRRRVRQAVVEVISFREGAVEAGAESLLVLSGERRRAGGAAHRTGRVKVGEPHAGASQRVDM